MARIDVIMPQMGESIAEGTLSKWLKKVGDEVKRDEPIFEISTDKVDAEIPAPVAGVLAEILVTEGQTVPVQTVVARLETEKGAALSAPPPAAAPAPAGAPRVAAPAPVAAMAAAPAPARAGEAERPGRVVRRARPHALVAARPQDRRRAGARDRGDAGARGSRAASPSATSSATSRRAPRRRRCAPPPRRPTAPPSMHAPGGAAAHGPLPEAWPGDVVEPMSVMRQRISEHMVASRRTSAHVTSFMEIDFTRVARIRAQQRAAFEEATGQKLTYMPFIIKSVVKGLKEFPIMNSSVAGTNVIYRKQYNIGVAVALDWGLIVPVIKRADDLSLAGITRTLNDLAARARAKKLNPEEVQGGTFTITNPGVFGSLMGTPIISQPQVAVLGVGTIEKRPKVKTGPDGEDVIAIRTCSYFSISFDHRIIDGAVADQFLAYVKAQIETFPDGAL